jgi:hypothetical protein
MWRVPLERAAYRRVLKHVSRQLQSFHLRLWGWLSYR